MFHVEQSARKITLVNTKDYLVSGERFSVVLDPFTQVAKTTPTPPLQQISDYYVSEDYISHGNNKKSIADRMYGFAKTIMLYQKEKWIRKHASTKKRYLDFGCGTGDFVRYLNKKGWQASGLEPNDKARAVNQLEEVVSNLDQLKQTTFDSTGLWHVLEHLPNPNHTLRELYSLMTPEANLFLAVPNFNSFDAKHYNCFWAAYDVPRHLWHFSSEGINMLCQKAGFRLIQKKGLLLDAFYICYLSEKHQNHSFALLRGLFWGMVSNLNALRTGEYSAMLYVFSKSK